MDRILIKIWNFAIMLLALPFILAGIVGMFICVLEIDDKVTNMYDFIKKSKNFKEVK
jgi:hypothetical protein